ncbi:hypothetical protein HYX58_02510 [Candidatus Dependentiae bacterium]|nr:hypothetical protein [Candidatus Dependentiae bacterium]
MKICRIVFLSLLFIGSCRLLSMDKDEKLNAFLKFDKIETVKSKLGSYAGNELLLQAKNSDNEIPFKPFSGPQIISNLPKILPENWSNFKNIVYMDPKYRIMFALVPVSTEQYYLQFDRKKIPAFGTQGMLCYFGTIKGDVTDDA